MGEYGVNGMATLHALDTTVMYLSLKLVVYKFQ